MAMRCQITGKGVMSGNNVSHAKNRTRRRFLPNLQQTSMQSEILGRKISLRVATSSIRTVEKHGGLDAFLLQARNTELADDARALKREILAASATGAVSTPETASTTDESASTPDASSTTGA